jgi:hypothetical protein
MSDKIDFEQSMRDYGESLGSDISGVPVQTLHVDLCILSCQYPCWAWRGVGAKYAPWGGWSPVVPRRNRGNGVLNGVVVPLFVMADELPSVESVTEAVRGFELVNGVKPAQVTYLRGLNSSGVVLEVSETPEAFQGRLAAVQDVHAGWRDRIRYLKHALERAGELIPYIDEPPPAHSFRAFLHDTEMAVRHFDHDRSNPTLIFYLDDVRDPNRYPVSENYIVVRTLEQAKAIIEANAPFPMWSLDHDLGGDDTGMDFLKWAAEHALGKWPKGQIGVHSANPVGADNMRAFIKQVERELL